MNKSQKRTVKQLGIDLQNTHSEKTFKELYDILRVPTIDYYRQYGNSTEVLEDCYNVTMIQIWNDIDKYDVHTWTIMTMIYRKMQQHIIKYHAKAGGQGNSSDIDDTSISSVNKAVDKMSYNMEDDYIENEMINTFWTKLQTLLNNEMYNMLYDSYVNNMKGKDIAKKYGVKHQTVLNRIYNAKKQIRKHKSEYENYFI